MPDLPTGTVTLLFSDIEGSTRLLQQQGERYGSLLADYRALLRTHFQQWGGHEVDTQGDAFFVVFPRAVDAVRAAVAVQQALATHPWPEGLTVRTRIGLPTGGARRIALQTPRQSTLLPLSTGQRRYGMILDLAAGRTILSISALEPPTTGDALEQQRRPASDQRTLL